MGDDPDSRSNVVLHIKLAQHDGWPPFDREEVIGDSVGDHLFRLVTPPSFGRRLAVGDVVRARHYGDSDMLWIDSVTEYGGHSTVRVIARGGADIEEPVAVLRSHGCVVRDSPLARLIVADIPPEVSYRDLRAKLQDGEDRGLWEYEEAAISSVHDSQ